MLGSLASGADASLVAKNKTKKTFFNNVIHQMFQWLEQIVEDVVEGGRIKDDPTYMVYLEELFMTTEKLVNSKLKYSQEVMLWPNLWA